MNIHKTAVLDKSVYLGKNVEIGAFSQILGNVQIGDNVKIKSNCVIGAEADQPRVDRLGDQNGSIVIQDGCVIKDSVIISKPTLTEVTKIGSNSYLMSGAYIAHDSVLGKNVIISHGARLSGYTTVDDFSNIGANATTHQKTKLHMGMRQECRSLHWLRSACGKPPAEFGHAFLAPRSRASGRRNREDRLERGIRADDAALVQALLLDVRPDRLRHLSRNQSSSKHCNC